MITGQEATSGRIERRLPDRVPLPCSVSFSEVFMFSCSLMVREGRLLRPSFYLSDLRLLIAPRRLLPE